MESPIEHLDKDESLSNLNKLDFNSSFSEKLKEDGLKYDQIKELNGSYKLASLDERGGLIALENDTNRSFGINGKFRKNNESIKDFFTRAKVSENYQNWLEKYYNQIILSFITHILHGKFFNNVFMLFTSSIIANMRFDNNRIIIDVYIEKINCRENQSNPKFVSGFYYYQIEIKEEGAFFKTETPMASSPFLESCLDIEAQRGIEGEDAQKENRIKQFKNQLLKSQNKRIVSPDKEYIVLTFLKKDEIINLAKRLIEFFHSELISDEIKYNYIDYYYEIIDYFYDVMSSRIELSNQLLAKKILHLKFVVDRTYEYVKLSYAAELALNNVKGNEKVSKYLFEFSGFLEEIAKESENIKKTENEKVKKGKTNISEKEVDIKPVEPKQNYSALIKAISEEFSPEELCRIYLKNIFTALMEDKLLFSNDTKTHQKRLTIIQGLTCYETNVERNKAHREKDHLKSILLAKNKNEKESKEVSIEDESEEESTKAQYFLDVVSTIELVQQEFESSNRHQSAKNRLGAALRDSNINWQGTCTLAAVNTAFVAAQKYDPVLRIQKGIAKILNISLNLENNHDLRTAFSNLRTNKILTNHNQAWQIVSEAINLYDKNKITYLGIFETLSKKIKSPEISNNNKVKLRKVLGAFIIGTIESGVFHRNIATDEERLELYQIIDKAARASKENNTCVYDMLSQSKDSLKWFIGLSGNQAADLIRMLVTNQYHNAAHLKARRLLIISDYDANPADKNISAGLLDQAILYRGEPDQTYDHDLEHIHQAIFGDNKASKILRETIVEDSYIARRISKAALVELAKRDKYVAKRVFADIDSLLAGKFGGYKRSQNLTIAQLTEIVTYHPELGAKLLNSKGYRKIIATPEGETNPLKYLLLLGAASYCESGRDNADLISRLRSKVLKDYRTHFEIASDILFGKYDEAKHAQYIDEVTANALAGCFGRFPGRIFSGNFNVINDSLYTKIVDQALPLALITMLPITGDNQYQSVLRTKLLSSETFCKKLILAIQVNFKESKILFESSECNKLFWKTVKEKEILATDILGLKLMRKSFEMNEANYPGQPFCFVESGEIVPAPFINELMLFYKNKEENLQKVDFAKNNPEFIQEVENKPKGILKKPNQKDQNPENSEKESKEGNDVEAGSKPEPKTVSFDPDKNLTH